MKALFIILLSVIIIVIYFSRFIGYKSDHKLYNFLSALHQDEVYRINKSTSNPIDYQRGDRFPLFSGEGYSNDIGKQANGYLFNDHTNHQLWMESTERLDKYDGHLALPVTQRLTMDLNRGNTIAAPCIILKDEIPDSYNWKHKPLALFMEYFFKTKFNWSSMNLINGIGSSNGASSYTLDSIAYFKLTIRQGCMRFKLHGANISHFKIGLFRLLEIDSACETVFLYVHDKYINEMESSSLRLINYG